MAADFNFSFGSTGAAGVARDLGRIGDEADEAEGSARSLGDTLKTIGKAALGAFAVTRVKAFASEMVGLYDVQAKAEAKVAQAIRSTAGAAKLSLAELKAEASALQSQTIFGDEEILNSATAQLLTFTNIASDNFKRTQVVALDLATVLDGDLKSSSIQLGKALNDPVTGLSALGEAGIQFSVEQKALINSLAATNRLAEAQDVILKELERQYGGQAKAAVVGVGAFTQYNNAISDIKESIGKALVDQFYPFTNWLSGVVSPANSASQAIIEQQVQVKALTGILLDNNSAESVRMEALNQLKTISPEVVKGLNAQSFSTENLSGTTDQLNAALKALNIEFEKQIKLAVAQEKVTQLREESAKLIKTSVAAELELNKAYAEVYGTQKQLNTSTEDQIRIMKEAGAGGMLFWLLQEGLAERGDKLTDVTLQLNEAMKDLTKTQTEAAKGVGGGIFGKLLNDIPSKLKAVNTEVAETTKVALPAAGSIDALQMQLSKLNEQFSSSTNIEAMAGYRAQIIETEAEIKKLNETAQFINVRGLGMEAVTPQSFGSEPAFEDIRTTGAMVVEQMNLSKAAINETGNELEGLKTSLKEIGKGALMDLASGLGRAFGEAIKGTKSLEDSLKELASQIAQTALQSAGMAMIQMAPNPGFTPPVQFGLLVGGLALLGISGLIGGLSQQRSEPSPSVGSSAPSPTTSGNSGGLSDFTGEQNGIYQPVINNNFTVTMDGDEIAHRVSKATNDRNRRAGR